MNLPHPMVIDGVDIDGGTRCLTFTAHGDLQVHVAIGVHAGLYDRRRLTTFLRLVVKVLEAGEVPGGVHGGDRLDQLMEWRSPNTLSRWSDEYEDFRCRCGGVLGIPIREDNASVVHTLPMCDDFDQMEPADFLAKYRHWLEDAIVTKPTL